MPVVNPGIRRYIGSAIQRLFNSASFSAPLTHSLTLERGTGSPTFTRATTGTVQDNEGILRTAIAGEARFPGARRVRNLLTGSTENFSNAAWIKTGTCAATATGFSFPAELDTVRQTISGTPVGNVLQSAFIISGSGTITFRQDNYESVDHTITLTATPTLYCYSGAVTSTPNFYFIRRAGNTATAITLTAPRLVDVTAETDQTTPREYVPVGVPSSWHGTDLVTNGTFDTDTTGWSATNSSLSVVSGGMRVTNVGANAGYGYQAITTIVGTKYVIRADITLGTSSSFGVYVGNAPGAGTLGGLSGSASGTFTSEFTATATTTYLNPINLQAVDGRYTTFDNIVVKPAVYHGSMVDGVKCFDTSLTGAAIPAATNLGYLAEAASTNLAWPSEDLTNVRYVSGGGGIAVVANQAVAPDGTTTADQLTASGANGTLIQDLGVVASAARNFSIYLKRKTGTGNIDLTLDGGATWTTKAITTTEWTRVDITQTLADPDIGIRIVTSGDAIYAWGVQCE